MECVGGLCLFDNFKDALSCVDCCCSDFEFFAFACDEEYLLVDTFGECCFVFEDAEVVESFWEDVFWKDGELVDVVDVEESFVSEASVEHSGSELCSFVEDHLFVVVEF